MPNSEQLEIRIDMDRPCVECGAKGATQSGICLGCATKRIGRTRMANQRMRFGGCVKSVKTAVKEIGEQPRLVVSITLESATLSAEEIASLADLQRAEAVSITIENPQGKLALKPMATEAGAHA